MWKSALAMKRSFSDVTSGGEGGDGGVDGSNGGGGGGGGAGIGGGGVGTGGGGGGGGGSDEDGSQFRAKIEVGQCGGPEGGGGVGPRAESRGTKGTETAGTVWLRWSSFHRYGAKHTASGTKIARRHDVAHKHEAASCRVGELQPYLTSLKSSRSSSS